MSFPFSLPPRKTIANWIACLMCICLISDFNAAHYSYTITLFVLFTIYDFICTKKFYDPHDFCINKTVCTGIFIFYFTLFLSCFYRQDLYSLSSLFLFISWIIPGVLFLCISSKYDIRKGLSYGIYLGLILLCLYGLIANPPTGNIINFRFTSLKYNANQTAMIIELLIPFLIYFFIKEKRLLSRFFYGLGIIFSLICLLATQSRGGIGAFIIGIIISLIIYSLNKRCDLQTLKKPFFLSGIGIIIIICCFTAQSIHRYNPDNHHFGTERGIMWETSLKMWDEHKIAGIGVSRWKEAYYGEYHPSYLVEPNAEHFHPHNMFLNYLSTAGIVGEIGYLFFMFLLFKGMYTYVKRDPIFVFIALMPFSIYFFHGFLDDTLVHKDIARLYYFAISLVFIYGNSVFISNEDNDDNTIH